MCVWLAWVEDGISEESNDGDGDEGGVEVPVGEGGGDLLIERLEEDRHVGRLCSCLCAMIVVVSLRMNAGLMSAVLPAVSTVLRQWGMAPRNIIILRVRVIIRKTDLLMQGPRGSLIATKHFHKPPNALRIHHATAMC